MEYLVHKIDVGLNPASLWDDRIWKNTAVLDVANFHRRSSEHRPVTQARVAHDGDSLYVLFQVKDRYLRCTRTDYNTDVCCDACVEFFVEPKPDKGYLNFEVNCIGTLHLGYHELPGPARPGPARREPVDAALGKKIQIQSTFSKVITDEIRDPVEWKVALHIPLSVLETYLGRLKPLAGSVWRANFYKCASDCSHAHWASWSPIGENLNFHYPESFAPLKFEP